MKTFFVTVLKIALVALVLWGVLHYAPVLVMPVVGVLALGLVVSVLFAVAVVVGLSVSVAVVTAVLAVILAIAAVLSPVWLPVLAVIGLIALCRPRPRPTA